MQVLVTRLAFERVKRGIKQKDFAASLGLAASTLSTVENGHRAPWPKLRADCAHALGVPEHELFPQNELGVRVRHPERPRVGGAGQRTSRTP